MYIHTFMYECMHRVRHMHTNVHTFIQTCAHTQLVLISVCTVGRMNRSDEIISLVSVI